MGGGGLGLRMPNVPLPEIGSSRLNHRFLNHMETVFVFVTFRGTSQFTANQPKANNGNEEDERDDHADILSKICTIFGVWIDFAHSRRVMVSNFHNLSQRPLGRLTWHGGMPLGK